MHGMVVGLSAKTLQSNGDILTPHTEKLKPERPPQQNGEVGCVHTNHLKNEYAFDFTAGWIASSGHDVMDAM